MLLGVYLEVEFLSHMVTFLDFLRNFQTLFQSVFLLLSIESSLNIMDTSPL